MISPAPATRVGAAWTASCVGALMPVVLTVFMLPNARNVEITFLWMDGTLPLALALLIAGVGVRLATAAIGRGAHRAGTNKVAGEPLFIPAHHGQTSDMEPIGDPDDENGDFAEEHESTEVTREDDGDREPESPERWSGGMDQDGPP